MRFLVDGIDIPNELIEAQEQGRVVFLCGAGVSFGAGLPGFGELVDGVYQALHERLEDRPAELQAYEKREYDRVLGLLTRRIGEHDVRTAPIVRREIRNAVRAALRTDHRGFPDHAALLQLSRNARQEPCLITTNFDTLFERASQLDLGVRVDSHASQALPAPQSERFSGVLHLHGRLRDDELDLDDTDLVLTSAEFGDAYLRSGWAARWLYDLTRTATIVLVGYSADDPPMRYLLETLDADRDRFPDLKPIYAFAGETSGADVWTAKGVQPITYKQEHSRDHRELYRTLHEWARAADDPRQWRDQRLQALLKGAPDTQQIEDIVSMLRAIDGTRLLADANPGAAWIGPLIAANAFKDDRPSPGPWIAKRLDDPETLAQWARHGMLSDWARDAVRRGVDNAKDLPPRVRLAWRALLRVAANPPSDIDERAMLAADRLQDGDHRASVVNTLVAALTPRLRINGPMRFFTEDKRPKRLNDYSLLDLIWVDYEPSDATARRHEVTKSIVEHPALLARFVRRLTAALENALEDATDYGYTGGGYDRASNEVRSVVWHAQDAHSGGFYPITRALVDLLTAGSPETIGDYLQRLRRAPFLLQRRIAIHLCSLEAIDAKTAAQTLYDLSDADFWDGDMRRESLRLCTLRWSAFPQALRRALEARIRGGPPKAIFNAEATAKNIREVRAHQIYLRLGRLVATGHALEDASQKKLDAIAKRYSYWKGPVSERGEFSAWSETRVGYSGNTKAVADLPPEELLQAAHALEEAKPWEQGQLLRVIAGQDPDRFLEALNASFEAGRTDTRAWGIFLGHTDGDTSDHRMRSTAAALSAHTDADLEAMASEVCWWLLRQYDRLETAKRPWPAKLDQLVQRLAGLQFPETSASLVSILESDRAILSSPAGNLASIAVREVVRRTPGESARKNKALGRLRRLVSAGGEPGTIALAVCAQRLSRLHYVAPDWAEKYIVPPLLEHTPAAHSLWRAKSYDGHPGTARLVSLIKVRLIAALRQGMDENETHNLLLQLLLALVWKQRGTQPDQPVEPADIKTVLTFGGAELRRHVSWLLCRWIENEKADAPKAWRNYYGPMFRAIWPRDAAFKDAQLTQSLISLVCATGNAFPDALKDVLPFLSAGAGVNTIYRLKKDEAAIIQRFPSEVLGLLDMVIRDAKHVTYDLDSALNEIVSAAPALANDAQCKRLRRLVAAARP